MEQCGQGGSSTVWLGVDYDGIRRAIRIIDLVQNIFGFQVVMGDSVRMKLLDSVENLGDAVEHFLFG